MYPTSGDIQQYISNDEIIIQQVVVKWNIKNNQYPKDMKERRFSGISVWITCKQIRENVFSCQHSKKTGFIIAEKNFILHRCFFRP